MGASGRRQSSTELWIVEQPDDALSEDLRIVRHEEMLVWAQACPLDSARCRHKRASDARSLDDLDLQTAPIQVRRDDD